MDILISNKDLFNATGFKPMTYREFSKLSYDDIKKRVIDNDEPIFLLYDVCPNFGHWTLLHKTVDDTNKPIVEFFDPMGYEADTVIPDGDFSFKYPPKVLQFLLKSNLQASYNDNKLQKQSSRINTCGRWVLIRYILRDMDLDKFANIFDGKNNDEEIVELSQQILGK